MKSIRYHLICELNQRWNVAFGSKMFEFKMLKTKALLALDECQSLQEVKNLMRDYRRYEMLSTTSGSQSAFYDQRQETTTTIGRTKNETWKTIVVDCFD